MTMPSTTSSSIIPTASAAVNTAAEPCKPAAAAAVAARRRSSAFLDRLLRRSSIIFPVTVAAEEDDCNDELIHPNIRRSSITTLAEQEQIEEMLKGLSEDEMELAARTNYSYTKQPCGHAQRLDCAGAMAKRYLRSKKDPKLALQKMKATLAFRDQLDVDGLCRTFDDPASKYREPLKEHLLSKMVYVQGYDNEGRATYIFEPRLVQHHDTEWTIKQHVWTLERAIACSKASDKTVNAVVNFQGFSVTKHAPPMEVGQQFLTTLRSHYTGHVNQIFLIDAPFAFLVLWKLFSPFVGRQTKSKIHFVSSDQQKRAVIGRLYSNEQATPWMLPFGQKDQPLDLEEYLATPFHQAFDE